MAAKATDTRHGRYVGPPGDEALYWMPRDRAAWEAAWAKHLGTQTPAEDVEDGSRGEVDMSPEAVEARRLAKRRHDEAMAFIAQYTGSFGLILDIRANPKYGTKYMKLSPRQVEAVLASRDRDAERIETARINTELWQDDEYLSWKEQTDARPETGEAPGLAPQPTPRTSTAGDVADGWYVVDGAPWKVQWNREKTRKYAKRLVVGDVRGGGRGDRDPGHHLAADGSWEYVPGGLTIIAQKGEPMTVEVAQAFGKLYGVCGVCGRILTDEHSIAAGIGPVCASNLS